MEPRLLKADEAARYLNYHAETLYELTRKGMILAVKVGRSLRWDRVELDKWIDKKIAESRAESLESPWSYISSIQNR